MGKYEEALERARQGLPMDKVFPELRMSEDERIRKGIIHFILYEAGNQLDEETEHAFITWLEKQKEQQSAEWSEEDEDYYDAIIAKLEITQDDAMLTDNQIDFLKTLPERFNLPPRQEWSEEDEKIWNDIFELCNRFGYDDACRKLKSLRPQSHWKPSEEQMIALEQIIAFKNPEPEIIQGCNSLCNDLKKLI